MKLVDKYMTFYLDGRGDDLFDDEDVDLDKLVDEAMKGEDPRTIALRVSDDLAAPLRHDRDKRDWIKDNKRAIKEAGGNEQLAFDHYVKGRVDQYAYSLEDELLSAMFEDGGDDEDEDDEEDEEDDGDES